MLSDIGSTGQAIGTATGWQGLSSAAQNFAQSQHQAEQEAGGRFESGDVNPWSLPGIGYQLAKFAPSMAGMMLAGSLVPEAAVPAWLSSAGAVAPRLIGGGGALEAGADDAARAAASMFGRDFAHSVTGATITGFPIAVGRNVQEAEQGNQGAPLSQGQAIGALGLGGVEAPMYGLLPAEMRGGEGPEGKLMGSVLLKRLARGAAVGAPTQGIVAGATTALTQLMGDPNRPVADRAREIVNNAMSGGLAGGVFGGLTGLLHSPDRPDVAVREKSAPDVSDEDMKLLVDAATNRGKQAQGGPTTVPTPERPYVATSGEALKVLHQQFLEAPRGGEMNYQHLQVAEELARATQPGQKFGEGALYTPEERTARAPDVEKLKATLIAGVPKKIVEKDSFFTQFNAATPPELVNAVRAKVESYKNAKDVPDWLRPIAEKVGVMDGKKIIQPAEEAANLQVKIDDANKIVMNSDASDKARATALREVARIRPQMENLQALDKVHKDADVLMANANEPRPVTAIAMGDQSNAIRESRPAGLDVQSLSENGRSMGGPHAEGDVITKESTPQPITEASQDGEIHPLTIKDIVAKMYEPRIPANEDETPELPAVRPLLAELPPDIPIDPAIRTTQTMESAKMEAQALLNDPAMNDMQKRFVQRALDTSEGRAAKAGSIPDMRAPFNALKTLDVAASQAKPDGPWTDRTGNVVGTPSVPPEHVAYLDDVMHAMGMGNIRVAMVHPSDIGGETGRQNGFAGDYGSVNRSTGQIIANDPEHPGHIETFGPGNTAFKMYIKPGMSPQMTASTIAEEVGHIVQLTSVRNAPDDVKAGLIKAWQRATREGDSTLTAQDLLRATRTKAQTEEFLRGLDPNSLASDMPNAAYHRSFSEWFAGNVSRYMMSKLGAPRDALGRFFTAVGGKIKKLISYVTGKDYVPDETVANFLDKMGPAHEAMWGGESKSSVNFSLGPEDTTPKTPEDAEARNKEGLAANLNAYQDIVQRTQNTGLNIGQSFRRWLLGGLSRTGLGLIYGKQLPSSVAYGRFWELINATNAGKSKVFDRAFALMAALRASNPKMAAQASQYIADSQIGNGLYRGDLPFFDKFHKDLWEIPTGIPEKARLEWEADVAKHQEFHAALKSEYDALRKNPDATKAVEMHFKGMQLSGYMRLVGLMQPMIENWHLRDGVDLVQNPMLNPDDVFRRLSGHHDDVDKALTFYKGVVGLMRDGIDAHIKNTETAVRDSLDRGQINAKQAARMTGNLGDLKSMRAFGGEFTEDIKRGTYSPLGHGTGDFFVSGKMNADPDTGQIPREYAQHIRTALDNAGFGNIGIWSHSGPMIFTRVESDAQMRNLAAVFKNLEDSGHLEAGATRTGHPDTSTGLREMLPKFVQSQIAAIEHSVGAMGLNPGDSKDAVTIAALKHRLIGQLMDLLPENSASKSLRKRQSVSGFNTDMSTVAQKYAGTITRASTAASTSGTNSRLMAQMNQEVQDAKSGDPRYSTVAQDVAREIQLREAQQGWREPSNNFDLVQSGMHTLMIGANPAYLITVMSQIPILLHGELAKNYGIAKSAKAIVGVSARTFQIMKAVMQSPDWASVGFREDALRKAGVSDKDIQTIMHLDNSGGLTTYTNQQTALGEGGEQKFPGWSKYKNMANAMGLYGEMSVRVMAALASSDLYDNAPNLARGLSHDDYVKQVVSNSQYNWGVGESSRLTGPHGFVGQASRISLAFMQFQTHMLEKLYTEAHAFLGKDGVQAQKDAGMFLASHLVAVTALAGTLGLPFATVAAGAADKVLKTLTGRDDIDTQGLYRNWLTNVFGGNVEEVLAKGLPRALGIDISKLGDANLLPGTNFIVDKRKWEDRMDDLGSQLMGSAAGEISNLIVGGRDMFNGDYSQGAIKMLPEGLKSIAEAFRLSKYGYVNQYGTKLAMQPGAWDILLSSLGVDPASFAQQKEQLKIGAGLRAQTQYDKLNIERHLIMAAQNPESADFQTWAQRAIIFQQRYPNISGGPLMEAMQRLPRNIMQGVYSRMTGAPIGVTPYQQGMRRATTFGMMQQ